MIPFAMPMFMAAKKLLPPPTATWNPSDKNSHITLSNGNLTAASPAVEDDSFWGVRSTTSHSSGKYYFECTVTQGNPSTVGYIEIGVGTSDYTLSSRADASGFCSMVFNNGANNTLVGDIANGSYMSGGATVTTGTVIGIAVDITGQKFYASHDGVWYNSADPGAGTGGFNIFGTTLFVTGNCSNFGQQAKITLNLGGSDFSYSTPAGYNVTSYW